LFRQAIVKKTSPFYKPTQANPTQLVKYQKNLTYLLCCKTQGEHIPATFVAILASNANSYTKVYMTVKQSNLHFFTEFG